LKNTALLIKGSSLARELGITALSIILAFGISAFIIWAAGFSVSAVFINLWKGAFGGKLALGSTLTKSTPIILTSLSFLIAFRAGLFNIGAEGQLYIGAMVGTSISRSDYTFSSASSPAGSPVPSGAGSPGT